MLISHASPLILLEWIQKVNCCIEVMCGPMVLTKLLLDYENISLITDKSCLFTSSPKS